MKTDKNAQKNKTQQTVLGVLIAVVIVVGAVQYFRATSSDKVNASEKKYDNRHPYNASDTTSASDPAKPADAVKVVAKDDGTTPVLDLDQISFGGKSDVNIDRNPFLYPPPPQPKPGPPPKPATLPISQVTPSSVFAGTKAFEVIVRGQGQNFTEADRIYINASPSFGQTKFINASELRATVPQQLFTAPQQMRVEVKRPGLENEFFSDPLAITINAAPQPRFIMLGQYNDGSGKNPHAVLTEGDNRFVVGIGESINNTWKVINIGPAFIDVEDVTAAIGVRHQVKMKDDNPAGVGAGFNQNVAYNSEAFAPQPDPQYVQNEAPVAAQAGNNPAANGAGAPQNTEADQIRSQQQEVLRKQREDLMRRRQEMIQQRLNSPAARQ